MNDARSTTSFGGIWLFRLYSQERLASYGIQPAHLPDLLKEHNIILPAGYCGSRQGV
jgi:hypothetical protein